MPRENYRGISLQRELVDKIEEYIKNHPEAGYRSLADFVTEALRKRCEELKILGPRPEQPALEHFNVNQDHVTVIDHKRRMFADVYFRNDHVYCELCGEEGCEHVRYALSLSKVQKALERKGLVIRGGKILQKLS